MLTWLLKRAAWAPLALFTFCTAHAQNVATAPVTLRGDTLLRIETRVGAFSAQERAAAISARLTRLARDPVLRLDTIRAVPVDAGVDIVAGDVIIMTVTPADAAAAGTTVAALASSHTRAIQQRLAAESLSTRLRTIGVGVLFALLTALATILVFRLVQRLFSRAMAAAAAGRETWTFALRIQRQVIMEPARIADLALWILTLVRAVTLVLLLYVSIPLILSFFPWTRDYANQLFGYILTPFAAVWEAFVGFIPNLFTIGAILVVTWYALKLIKLIFVGIARGNLRFSGFYPEWAIPTYKLVRILVFAFALVMIWPYLPGSDSPAFRGVGVILGLVISFGSASAIGNAVGGVVLTYMRPFKVGDRVKIADTTGDIVDRDLLVTRIRTIKNVDITIPNSMVLGSHIVNYSSIAAQHGVILSTTVTIGYDVPWRHVHELLSAAARATAGVLVEPGPFVLQTSLDDNYVSYELNAYIDQPHNMARIYSGLHENIQDQFAAAGVEIMSPHYRAVRDGNMSTIPARPSPQPPPAD